MIDRRVFMKLAAGTVAYAAGGVLSFGAELPQQLKGSLAAKLASRIPAIDGVFVFDDAVCRAMASDYGHSIHRVPIGVLFPKSPRDIQKIVQYASSQGLKIAMRGHGCCAYGQSQVDRGIVIDSANMSNVSWATSDSVDVEPGATWHEVVTFSLLKGMTPPVLPDTLFLTIGGTLSVGGVGETSYRLGAQVDHISEVDVITGKGDLLTCSSTQNQHLFSAVLAGMGQCGLIVRARTRLLPAPINVISRQLQCADRSSFLGDLTLIAQQETSGAVAGLLSKTPDGSWKYLITVNSWSGSQSEPTASPWEAKVSGKLTVQPSVTAFENYINRNTQWYLNAVGDGSILVPHPYMSFFLSEAATPEMISYIVTNPEASLGATAGPVFPMFTKHFKQPLQKMPAGNLAFHIRLYRKAAQEGSEEHRRMIKVNTEEFIPRILATGGTVYPPHSPLLTTSQWVQHYGQATMSFLAEAKKRYDPNSVLNPGPSILGRA